MFFSYTICGRTVILRFMQKAKSKEAFLKDEKRLKKMGGSEMRLMVSCLSYVRYLNETSSQKHVHLSSPKSS
jgi:hypothetical protein